MTVEPEFMHADADPDDAYSADDVPLEEIDWDQVAKVKAAFDDVADPNTPTTAVDALNALYGDDLQVM